MAELVQRDWEIIEVDIANAFITSTLPKPIFMRMPKVIAALPAFDKSSVGQSVYVNSNTVNSNGQSYKIDSPTSVSPRNTTITNVVPSVNGTVTLSDGTTFDNPPRYQNKICKVMKSLYGLAVAPATFHNSLNAWFKSNGYTQSTADSCLWLKYSDDGVLQGALIEWVDDILVVGTSDMIADFRKRINDSYKIRDYGTPTDFVGMQLKRNRKNGTLKLYQRKYIERMATRYGIDPDFTTDNPSSLTPVNFTAKLHPAEPDEARADSHEYRSIVGALHFCAHSVRPEIAAPITQLSRYLADPSVYHLKQARKILLYLVATKDFGLEYCRNKTIQLCPGITIFPNTLVGFADATWADDVENRRSQTGYAFLLNGAAISWCSKQQREIAKSSSDAEFRAYNSAGCEALFLRKLMSDFTDRTQDRNATTSLPPTTIYSDNTTAIKWLKNKSHHSKTKHIDTLTLKIREQVTEFNTLKVEPVRTEFQTADVLSKALGSIAHWRHSRVLLGLPDPEAGKDFKIRRAGTETDSPSSGPKEVLSQTGSATG